MIRFSAHEFTGEDWNSGTMPFDISDYSYLKFGDDEVAKRYGYELAEAFFTAHSGAILARPSVVIPSPYNYVENAATIMCRHFVHRLNKLLVNSNGMHVDYSIIHRKVSYTGDFGFLSAKQRNILISQDDFYLNERFYAGKNILFLDDVRISGAHENRLRGLLKEHSISEDNVFFLYYAQLIGEGVSPEIEGKLNMHGMQSLDDYVRVSSKPDHRVIVRPIKFTMARPADEFVDFTKKVPIDLLRQIYFGCLGEGYYQIPTYQVNFGILQKIVENHD